MLLVREEVLQPLLLHVLLQETDEGLARLVLGAVDGSEDQLDIILGRIQLDGVGRVERGVVEVEPYPLRAIALPHRLHELDEIVLIEGPRVGIDDDEALVLREGLNKCQRTCIQLLLVDLDVLALDHPLMRWEQLRGETALVAVHNRDPLVFELGNPLPAVDDSLLEQGP